MPKQNRMNRQQFFAKVEAFDAEALRKILWNLYWRGARPLRERIEDALEPGQSKPKPTKKRLDGAVVLSDIQRFVQLARSGAYMGGTREVHRTERSRWRFTFKDYVKDAMRLIEQRDLEHGLPAIEFLIDLACDCRGYEYFHSEDPVEAMKLVVSDIVTTLWRAVLEREGFAVFAQTAAPQLIKWESQFGWTRTGFGPTRGKECSLTDVLTPMLRGHDAWVSFTDAYLSALDSLIPEEETKTRRYGYSERYELERRTDNLKQWHGMLLDELHGTDAQDRVERLVRHKALAGSELTFLEAQLRHRDGDIDSAHKLIQAALERKPGHDGFLDFAKKIGAKIPERARSVARRRGRS